jgi:hypothetical protein
VPLLLLLAGFSSLTITLLKCHHVLHSNIVGMLYARTLSILNINQFSYISTHKSLYEIIGGNKNEYVPMILCGIHFQSYGISRGYHRKPYACDGICVSGYFLK